jgi:uncharacterized protein (UPF0248 family)
MSPNAIQEILDKLPYHRRREIYDFIQFIYQKSQESGEEELLEHEINELKERREAYLKNPTSGISLEEGKKRLLGKYGL